MDEDTVGILIFIAFLAVIFAGPFLLIFTIFACTAWGRTTQWKKQKLDRARGINIDIEREALVENSDDDDDLESITSEDEAENKAREEEAKPDWDLTTSQKFRKELKKAWKGQDAKEAAKKKEKEEAQRLAKAVSVEMARIERRRERKARKQQALAENGESSRGEDGLPSYNNAVAAVNDVKR